jgi:hypothetical protein
MPHQEPSDNEVGYRRPPDSPSPRDNGIVICWKLKSVCKLAN